MKATSKTTMVLMAAALLTAASASAQVKRTVLQQVDTSTAGREAVTAKAEIPAGGSTGLHTHPGEEISYVLEGSIEVVIDGVSKNYKAGEAFAIMGGKAHDAKAVGGPAVVIANYIIEKGKPVTTPVK
jgi:quercetin dioxygenase-like cupin family protein